MPDPSARSGSPRPFDELKVVPSDVEGRAESSGDWKSYIRSRLASLRLSPARESEIAEELAQHLDDRWRELVARGATPEDASQIARTEFDGARLEALLGTLRQAHWHERRRRVRRARFLSTACSSICDTPSGP